MKHPKFFPMRIFLLSGMLAAAAVACTAQTTSATCLADAYGKNTQCTANDVRIAYATNPRNLDGSALTSCNAGTTFKFVADFHVVTTATARENIGLYFATGGQASALTGSCSPNIIAPLHSSSNPLDKVTLGSAQYEELDSNEPNAGSTGERTGCGDISTSDNNQVVTVEVDNVVCQASPGTDQLALPNCTSWQQPGGAIQCISPGPYYPWVSAAIPGSPSKCSCNNGFTVPITVQNTSFNVDKTCTTGTDTDKTSCDAGQEGGPVTYNLAIKNGSNFGGVVIDQICDSAYGNVFTASGFTPACTTTGTIGTMDSTTCSALSIAEGGTETCSFTVTQGENQTVKDIVSVIGHGTKGGGSFTASSNQVTVTSEDAPTTGTITKSLNSTPQACATFRYKVDVKNTSGADETLTLSALTDTAFGAIAPTPSASIVATTCGKATESGGAGLLPVTLATGGGDYQCTFDAQYCAAPTSIVVAEGTCTSGTCTAGNTGAGCTNHSECNVTCTGIQHTNQVTATLTGDEGETVTLTPGSLTAIECITTVAQ